jgi:hypothetical protein
MLSVRCWVYSLVSQRKQNEFSTAEKIEIKFKMDGGRKVLLVWRNYFYGNGCW